MIVGVAVGVGVKVIVGVGDGTSVVIVSDVSKLSADSKFGVADSVGLILFVD
jgi:hypothetical protein